MRIEIYPIFANISGCFKDPDKEISFYACTSGSATLIKYHTKFCFYGLIKFEDPDPHTKKNQNITKPHHSLQRQNTEISKQGKEYWGLSPNFHIHASVSDLYIPTIGRPILLEEICRPILGLYKSLTDT